MKKIGICACYDTRNYGSMLQALATQITIDNLGYESEYIVYKKKKTAIFLLKQIPRLFNRNLMYEKWQIISKKMKLKKHPEICKEVGKREVEFIRFQKQYYRRFSPVYYGYDELKKSAQKYDAVVVGSDQLWLPAGLATNFYNLMFVPDNVRKVSYATSFGVSKIPKYQYKRTKEYLSRIEYLSVREQKGAEIVKEISGCEAKIVADPTLLLSKEEWANIIPDKDIIGTPYIFCYFLGENEKHREIANELKRKTGLPIVCIPYLDSFVQCDMVFGDKQLFEVGPDNFVNLIRYADYVLTDSFHGSVFSIIHHKQFIVFNRFDGGTQSRNSRIDSLLGVTNLANRRFSKSIFEEMNAEIDYDAVDIRLEKLKQESVSYLENALEE